MSDVGNSLRVPTFITASTREELRQLMLENNLRAGKEFTYFDLQKDGKLWVAWYYDVLEIDMTAKMLKFKGGA